MIHETLVEVNEIEALAFAIERAPRDGYVAIDCETGASPEMRAIFPKAEFHPYSGAYVTGMSVCLVAEPGGTQDELCGYYVPIGHQRGNASPAAVQRLCRALTQTRAKHVLHHAVFDWAFLVELGAGYEPRKYTLDTQVVRWWQDENARRSLKGRGVMYLDEDADAEQKHLAACRAAPVKLISDARRAVLEAYPELGYYRGKGKVLRPGPEAEALAQQLVKPRSWAQLTVEELGLYAARDATMTAEIAEYLCEGHAGILHPGRGIQREMKLQLPLYRMTKKGVYADVAQLDIAAETYQSRADYLQLELQHEHGLDNPSSSKQCAHLLYDVLGLPIMGRTPSGAPATDKNALEMLQGNPIAAQILAYRKWQHAADSYAGPFAAHARASKDGRIHGHYGSTNTVTGRLSASGPNVMTIPRDDSLPEIRAAFNTAPPGYERLGFDLASAELWVTASLTGDPHLSEVLLEGRNLHIETMLAIFGGEPDKSRREYTLSKNGNYGIEYGAGIDQLTIYAAKAGCSPREAKRVAKQFRDGHKETFPVMHRRAAFFAREAERLGRIPLHVPGRYRHFRSPHRMVQFYTALNAMVQGGVAEFMKDTMLALEETWAAELLILQVHDELVFDAPVNEGMEPALLALLTQISHDINPFRYELRWDAKKWRST